MNKVKVEVLHVIEVYKRKSDGEQVYQLKLKAPGSNDVLGETAPKHYYIKVTNPKVKVGDTPTIDLDAYETYLDEWIPDGEDKVITLTYLKPKGH